MAFPNHLPIVKALSTPNHWLDLVLLFFLIFSACTTIVAAVLGFFSINPFLIVIFSFLITFFLLKRFPFKFEIPLGIWFLSAFLFLLLIFPAITTQGIAASADAVTTTSMRTIAWEWRIPETYSPYSNISFSYQIGFPLLASVLHAWLPWIPDYQFAWILGSIFAAILPLLIFSFVFSFFQSKSAAVISAFLIFGSKLVFENFYWGEYAWVTASIFLLLCPLLLKKNNPLGLLGIPMVATLHPAILLNLIFVLGILFLFRQISSKWISTGIASLVLAIPAFYFNYTIIFNNIFSGNATNAFAWQRVLTNGLAVPAWIGLGLSIIFLLACANKWYSKSRGTVPNWLLAFAALSIAGFIALIALGTQYAGREIELVALSALFLSAILISESRWYHRNASAVLGVILIIGLLSFSFSGTLQKSRAGSKINAAEIAFAKEFYRIDPTVQSTIFLTRGGGKMAEIANKQPFDANQGQFVTVSESLIVHNAAWEEFELRHRIQSAIIANACSSCVLAIRELKYAVIDESFTPIQLDKPVLMETGSLKLYQLN